LYHNAKYIDKNATHTEIIKCLNLKENPNVEKNYDKKIYTNDIIYVDSLIEKISEDTRYFIFDTVAKDLEGLGELLGIIVDQKLHKGKATKRKHQWHDYTISEIKNKIRNNKNANATIIMDKLYYFLKISP